MKVEQPYPVVPRAVSRHSCDSLLLIDRVKKRQGIGNSVPPLPVFQLLNHKLSLEELIQQGKLPLDDLEGALSASDCSLAITVYKDLRLAALDRKSVV